MRKTKAKQKIKSIHKIIPARKIIPHLWFDDKAEEAANFYISIFRNSKILKVTRYGEAAAEVSGRPKGSVLTVEFRIEGQDFVALNGGPMFSFTPAISFLVSCKTQEEVDRLWDRLLEGGQPEQCGWLKDKYGVSWQVVPAVLEEMLSDPDPERAERVMKAMLQMVKLDIKALKNAYGEKPQRKTA
jgi:predicted 3-demethylubiquinone-9 3-methyltransferase (glyoxalase superfamily)